MNPIEARRMRDVRRLSGCFITRPYSIAEHCYFTGMLFEDIAEIDHVRVTRQEIHWVYRHDALEIVTGDLLYPVKNMNEVTQKAWATIENEVVKTYPSLLPYVDDEAVLWFSLRAWRLFRECDGLELYLFCKEERLNGNVVRNSDGSSVEKRMEAFLIHSKFKGVLALLQP